LGAALLFWPILIILLMYGIIVKKHYITAFNGDIIVYEGFISNSDLMVLSGKGLVKYKYNSEEDK